MPGELDPQAQAYLDEVAKLGYRPMYEMTPAEARACFDDMIARFGGSAEPIGRIEDREIEGPAGKLPARVYTPDGEGPFPMLVFFHGGGFVVGDRTTAEPFVQRLSNRTGCVAVSVEYRLAPEHPFPAAPEDAYGATRWIVENADLFNGDGRRVAVGGDSAGANLAAAVALMARDRGGPSLACQLLYYGAFNLSSPDAESYGGDTDAQQWMDWILGHYLPNEQDRHNAYASPLLAKDLAGLPNALVLLCEFDCYRDEGEQYAHRLEEAGVPVKMTLYEGIPHGFLCGAFDRAEDAIAESAAELRAAFG